MENRNRKVSYSISDAPSPVMPRRRLSAPETVMRKHILAQQRSESQDSDVSLTAEARNTNWRHEASVGSDPNLNRKRDLRLTRRSTLLRRLWNHTGPPSEKTSSLSSSPEHNNRKEFGTSPKNAALKRLETSPLNKRYNLAYTDSSSNRNHKNTDKMSKCRIGISPDQPDSAYTNSRSSIFPSSPSRSVSSEIQKVIVGSSDASNENVNKLDQNVNEGIKNSETQTVDTTNVNVISNVQLSKSTLDVIYNHVMRDVQNNLPSLINISAPIDNSINIQQVPSFYLKREEDDPSCKQSQILKYMIGNVNTGSLYSKPAEVPQVVVPRFSAYPCTSSMEVNPSSADSTDRESDSVSLVDSLEDPSSPRSCHGNKYDDKPVRGDISSLLPPNESTRRKVIKTSAFFIPIESTTKPTTRPVAEHLPNKVRERLVKRQARREAKMQETKNKYSPRTEVVSSSESSNQLHIEVEHATEYQSGEKRQKKGKPLLPRIQTIRKVQIDSKEVRSKNGSNTCDSKSRYSWSPRSKRKNPERLTPLYTSKNEYFCNQVPGRIFHKTEMDNSNKRIEILEIMECVDVTPNKCLHNSAMCKSKIPVFVKHRKLPKISGLKREKPTFLDFNAIRIDDPKIDQLIANILIDTLHNDVQEEHEKANVVTTKPSTSRHSKYQHRFEVIPEEFQQSSVESCNNNNNENTKKTNKKEENENNNKQNQEAYKGKAALSLEKDENLATIPQGWITFYMLQNSQGSPESSSDEGSKKTKNEEICHNDTTNTINNPQPSNVKTNSPETSDKVSSASELDFSQNSSILQEKPFKLKRQIPSQKINRTTKTQKSTDPRGWSVTVSGTSGSSDFAPNLEMRLNFPKSSQPNVDSRMGDSQSKRYVADHPKSHDIPNVSEAEDGSRCRLPSINKAMKSINYRYCGTTGSSVTVAEPRHTKTSSKRISLNRPRKLPLITPSQVTNGAHCAINTEETHIEELLLRFPHVLAVTGNAICKQRDPRVCAISERDLVITSHR